MTGKARPMKEIQMVVPVVHKSFFKFDMCWFVPLHQVVCYMHLSTSGWSVNKDYAWYVSLGTPGTPNSSSIFLSWLSWEIKNIYCSYLKLYSSRNWSRSVETVFTHANVRDDYFENYSDSDCIVQYVYGAVRPSPAYYETFVKQMQVFELYSSVLFSKIFLVV